MNKRIFAALVFLVCLFPSIMANQEISVELSKQNRVHTERLRFGYLTFEYLYRSGNNASVRVSLENFTQTPPMALLIFRRDTHEKNLKQGKPRIEFEKKYPGERGKRIASGCDAGYNFLKYNSMSIVTAAETDTLFTLDVPLSSASDISLPIYVAKYKPKDLFKKGKEKTTYKILEEDLYALHIEVEGWNENDSTYVNVKSDVDKFISSLHNVRFCPNKKHNPSLKKQQRPYIEKRELLIDEINMILDKNSDWMSTDAPHKAYTTLLKELKEIDLGNFISDCGNHKKRAKSTVSCNLCSLSAQNIYHRLDNLFQQLHSGKITKEQALNSARPLFNCYQHHKSRKKDDSYGSKIAKFYNRIANY